MKSVITLVRAVLVAVVVLVVAPTSFAFSVSPNQPKASPKTGSSRRETLTSLVAAVSTAVLVGKPTQVKADVWSGNELPKGAAQFNRIIRLRSDLRKVKKRVAEGAAEMDQEEWENIGKFLRTAYATGEDMKAVSAGIASPANKQRASEDIEQLRKYAQAADISVSKQDASGFVAIAEKMEFLVNDYFGALNDVPDEI